MTYEVIEAIAQRLRRSSIACCEYEDAGYFVRMRFGGDANQALSETQKTHVATPVVVGSTKSGNAIKAKATGVLRFAHPCASFAELKLGDPVAQGDIVCFLQIGEVLSAVTAHRAGTLGERLLPDGALVGYGEEVMAIT